MDPKSEAKLFGMLGVLSLEVTKIGESTTQLHADTAGLRKETMSLREETAGS